MQKINEQQLENIIRDVINEQLMVEGPDEGVSGGLKAAGKQIFGDLKNSWQNAKQAYKYGSHAQDKEREIRQNIRNTNNGSEGDGEDDGGEQQDTDVQQEPMSKQEVKQQAKKGMRFGYSSQRRAFVRQFIERDVVRVGKNYDVSPKELASQLEGIAKILRSNPQHYFPQTNESVLSNDVMEQLTEEIVARIKNA